MFGTRRNKEDRPEERQTEWKKETDRQTVKKDSRENLAHVRRKEKRKGKFSAKMNEK